MLRALSVFVGLLAASPVGAQLNNPSAGVDVSALATKAEVAGMAATIPAPSSSVPPGVADSGTIGSTTGVYALANHTHASKARKGRVTTLADGTRTIALTPAFSAVPICVVVAEATAGETNIVNAQLDGPPTTSQLQVRVNRSAAQLVGLLGLTINVVQPSVATIVDYICIEP